MDLFEIYVDMECQSQMIHVIKPSLAIALTIPKSKYNTEFYAKFIVILPYNQTN